MVTLSCGIVFSLNRMEKKYQLSYLATTSQTIGRLYRNSGRLAIGMPVGITPESRAAWAGIPTGSNTESSE